MVAKKQSKPKKAPTRAQRTKVLAYDPEVYTPAGLRRNLSPAEAKKEYQRLRSIAIRRLKTFEGTEFTDTQIYRYHKDRYPPVSKVSYNEMLLRLKDLSTFVRLKESTLAGLKDSRAKAVSTLQRHGYDVTLENLTQFGEYMEKAKSKSISRYFDSERAAELFLDWYEADGDAEDALAAFAEYEDERLKERSKLDRLLKSRGK